MIEKIQSTALICFVIGFIWTNLDQYNYVDENKPFLLAVWAVLTLGGIAVFVITTMIRIWS